MSRSVVVYCINLPEATERREFMLAQVDKIGFRMEFIEAISGRSLNIDEVKNYDRKRRLKFGEDLRPNEIACALSHMKAFETFLASDYAYVVVLEDDVTVKDDFAEVIKEVIKLNLKWDSIKLQSIKKNVFSLNIKTLELPYSLIIPMNVTQGTTGIMYSRAGAQKALKSLSKFYFPIDTHLGETYKHSLRTLVINPSLVCEDNLETTIGERTSTSDIHKGHVTKKVRFRIQKIKRSILKRFYAVYTWIVIRRSIKNHGDLKCLKSL